MTAAANAADIAVSNNYLNHVQEKQKVKNLKIVMFLLVVESLLNGLQLVQDKMQIMQQALQ